MIDPTASLEFGGLKVHGKGSKRQAGGIGFDVSADGITFGSAEDVLSVVRSFWADGSSVSQDGSDNAQTTFYLRIHGANLTVMAQGEARFRKLFPKHEQTVPLVWRPSADAPAAVRTVLHVGWELDFDGYAETGFVGRRVYQVTMTHAPFVASEFESVVAALPAVEGDEIVSIDPLTSTTKWQMGLFNDGGGFPSPSITTTPDGVRGTSYSGKPAPVSHEWWLRYNETVDFTGTPYLVLEYRVLDGMGTDGKPVHVTNAGTTIFAQYGTSWEGYFLLVSHEHMVDGWIRAVWEAPVTATNLRFAGFTKYSKAFKAVRVEVRALRRASSPSLTSSLALQRTLEVEGTERTPGALHVWSRDNEVALGSMLVHTCPDLGDGYTPELLDGFLSHPDGRTAGDDAPSGFWYPGELATMVPAYRYTPGSYMIVAWVKSISDQVFPVTATVKTAAGPVGAQVESVETVTRMVHMRAGETRGVPIGEVILPGVDSRSGAVTIIVEHDSGADSWVGGLWACRVGRDSALTFVHANQPHLYIQAGTRNAPSRILVSDVDGIDAGWHPGPNLQYLGPHTFPAGPMQTLVVADGIPNPAVELSYTPLWPWHPAHDGRTGRSESA